MVKIERYKEYDAFGPWIYEIDEEHEMPRMFRDYYNEIGDHLILFKVPRKIERRTASPNADLYDYLVGAYDEYLRIFKRAGRKVIDQKIYYKDITVVKDIHALLKGELILFTQSGPAVIEYNTVSEEIILKLINIIEKKICAAAQRIRSEGLPSEYPDDMLFFNLLNKLKIANPDSNLIAYQPAFHIKKTYKFRRKLKERDLSLSKTAFIINDKEFIVLERSLSVRKKYKEKLDYSYLYIPFKNITGAAVKEFDSDKCILILELRVKNQRFSYLFENNNRRMLDLYHKLYDFNRVA